MIGKQFFLLCSILLVALSIFSIARVNAILPPEHYRQDIKESQVKAIAIVQKIEILEDTNQSTKKNVTFKLVKSFSDKLPTIFEGRCYSVDREDQEPMDGGRIYYYPNLNQKVYVTIRKNKGYITSLNPLTKDFKAEVAKNIHNIYPTGLLNFLKSNHNK